MIKIEIGKTYRTRNDSKYLIVSDKMIGSDSNFVGLNQKERGFQTFNEDGKCYRKGESDLDIIKEWKEPVTHRRDVVWYKNGLGDIYVDTYLEGQTFGEHVTILKRQTVEYTEE